jgi:hypothetical protein
MTFTHIYESDLEVVSSESVEWFLLSLVLVEESSRPGYDATSAKPSICGESASVTSSYAMLAVSGSALSLIGCVMCLIRAIRSQTSRRGDGNEQHLHQQVREKAKATSSKEHGDLPCGTTALFIGAVKHTYYRALNGPICFPRTSHPSEDEW